MNVGLSLWNVSFNSRGYLNYMHIKRNYRLINMLGRETNLVVSVPNNAQILNEEKPNEE